jgi:hypothetical protein
LVKGTRSPFSVPDGEGEIGVERGATARSGLGVDHHRVDGERVDLPFPPVAFLAARDRGGEAFEHQALGADLAALGAGGGEVGPVVGRDAGGDAQRYVGGQVGDGFELRATLGQGPGAPVLAAPFQEVVGHQDHRRLGQELLRHRLAPDPGLQPREG